MLPNKCLSNAGKSERSEVWWVVFSNLWEDSFISQYKNKASTAERCLGMSNCHRVIRVVQQSYLSPETHNEETLHFGSKQRAQLPDYPPQKPALAAASRNFTPRFSGAMATESIGVYGDWGGHLPKEAAWRKLYFIGICCPCPRKPLC